MPHACLDLTDDPCGEDGDRELLRGVFWHLKGAGLAGGR